MKLRHALFAGLLAALLAGGPDAAADPAVDQLTTMSPDELREYFQQLPPEVQDQIRQQLQTKSPEALMAMTPDQLRAAMQNLSPDAKAQLKAKWASLSPDQKAQLKSLNLKSLWQQLVARFQAMGPAERAVVKKLLGQAVAGSQGQP
jgi:uroporphyrinogen-III synthase